MKERISIIDIYRAADMYGAIDIRIVTDIYGGDRMAREQFQSLTEQMYYILLALLEPRCGVDISREAAEISGGRLEIGPGTLYSLLAKFEQEGMIREVKTEGRKRYYQLTVRGRQMLEEEYGRLRRLVEEGRRFLEPSGEKEEER